MNSTMDWVIKGLFFISFIIIGSIADKDLTQLDSLLRAYLGK